MQYGDGVGLVADDDNSTRVSAKQFNILRSGILNSSTRVSALNAKGIPFTFVQFLVLGLCSSKGMEVEFQSTG